MSKWKNNKVDECIVKDSTKARMAFILGTSHYKKDI